MSFNKNTLAFWNSRYYYKEAINCNCYQIDLLNQCLISYKKSFLDSDLSAESMPKRFEEPPVKKFVDTTKLIFTTYIYVTKYYLDQGSKMIYFVSILTTLEASYIFQLSEGIGGKNWDKLKIEPLKANLTCPNMRNILYMLISITS
jgi:hypothetical protein